MFDYTHAYDLVTSRQRELIAEADRHRLINSVRRAARRERRSQAREGAAAASTAGTLAGCGPRETVPAR